MADDDEMTDEMDEEVEPDESGEFEVDEVDPDLEDADIDEEDDFVATEDEDFDDEAEGEDEEEAKPADTPQRRTTSEEEDDDDDLLTADDVEADLDTILKDRLVSAEEAAGEEDEDEEPEDRSDPGDRLQPKRADEQLCSNCFLLVRNSAPACPVGADDDCPIFG